MLFMVFLLTGAASVFASNPKDQWDNEILLQLSELRKAQGELGKQVIELKAEVQALRSSGQGGKRTSLDLRNRAYPVLGDANAGVAIVEFSDFECPYCRRHQKDTLPGISDKYIKTGKVRYFFVDFPLGFHPKAEPSAMAATCAQKQGAFWKMHDLLFANQSTLGEETFLKLASDLRLNGRAFKQCLQDPKVLAQVREQARLGDELGVQGTPAFLIGRIRNGVLMDAKSISGAQPLSSFERVVDQFLVIK